MCLTSWNAFQKHLLSQEKNLIFWPQKWIFEISEVIFDSFWHPTLRKQHSTATSKVAKKFLRPPIKNRLGMFVANVLGINLIPLTWSYDQNWQNGTLKTEKKAKTSSRVPFWNNRLHLLTKIQKKVYFQRDHPKPDQKHIYVIPIWPIFPKLASLQFSTFRTKK